MYIWVLRRSVQLGGENGNAMSLRLEFAFHPMNVSYDAVLKFLKRPCGRPESYMHKAIPQQLKVHSSYISESTSGLTVLTKNGRGQREPSSRSSIIAKPIT